MSSSYSDDSDHDDFDVDSFLAGVVIDRVSDVNVLHVLHGPMPIIIKKADPEDDTEPIISPILAPSPKRSQEQFEKTCSTLNNLRAQKATCDVLIVCGDRKIPAHRLILRAGSAYFEAMFSSGMQEASSFEVQFPTIPEKLMAIILDFIYMQCVNVEILSADELWDLVTAAHLIEVYPLVEVCIGELTKKINFGNWVTMLQGAKKYSSERLVTAVVQYLFHHNLTGDSELLGLDFDCFNSLIATSSNENLQSADTLVNLVVIWVAHNENDRKQHLLNLFSCIDFTSASREVIISLINNNNLVKNSLEVSHLLLKKISAVFNDTLSLKTATSNPKLLIIKSTSVHSFDLKKQEWSVHNLPINLNLSANAPVAVSENAVYFTADVKDSHGYQRENEMNILAFYPQNNCITAITTHSKLSKFAMVFLNDCLYLTGGIESSREKNGQTLEKYDFNLKKWSVLARPILRRIDPMVIALNNILYIFGGFQTLNAYQEREDRTQIRIVEKYCPITNQWTVITVAPGLKNIYTGYSAVPCFSKIYFKAPCTNRHNGEDYNANLLEFDPNENCWTELMKQFKPDGDGSEMWTLCLSSKPLPFLVVTHSDKFYRLDPRTEQCVLITQKPPRGTTVNVNGSPTSYRRGGLDDEVGVTVIFA